MVYSGLQQFNIIRNARNGVLDLILSNADVHGIQVSRSDFFLVQEDMYHPTLEINMKLNLKYLKENRTEKRNFRKADYIAINEELSTVDWQCIERLPIERAVDLFYTILGEIINRNVPKLRPSGKYPYWYSSDLIGLLRRKERARTKWRRSGSHEDYATYSDMRRLAKASAGLAYDEYIRNLQNDIPRNIKLFWSFSKNKRATNTYPSELSFNGIKSSSAVEISGFFAQYFMSTYSVGDTRAPSNPPPDMSHSNMNTHSLLTPRAHMSHSNAHRAVTNRSDMSHSNDDVQDTSANQPDMSHSNVGGNRSNSSGGGSNQLRTLDYLNFSLGNVEELLSNVDINKNGGPDGIPNVFLRSTARQLAVPLSIIFNKSVTTGIFPSQFKQANVTPIFKKGDKTDVTNYRPICILNSFSKIFEKLVHDRILAFLNDLFDKNQHGFMKNRSTLTNTSIFVNSVARNMEANVETHAIYTDFAKAFDSVDLGILLRKLRSYGITGELLRWFGSYLSDRNLRVAFGGTFSTAFTPRSGVPQGSVLGPLLFNIFINDLGGHLLSSYLLFADDLKIYAKIRSLGDAIVLQEDLVRLTEWCDRNRLKLNIGKCKFISFNAKRNPLLTTYYINDTPLEQVGQISDLGVLLDSKLKCLNSMSTTFSVSQ